jgi:hypothetical protein
MRFYGSQLYFAGFQQFRSEVLSGSDKFLPYALERKCVTTDIVSSGVVRLATSGMTGVELIHLFGSFDKQLRLSKS